MGVSEKRAPRVLSLSASLMGVAVCAFLFYRGEKDPRTFTSNMTINHHNGYDRTYACRECHVPEGGFFLTPTCVTSSCHGELQNGQPMEANVAHMLQYWAQHNKTGKSERTAISYLTTHANYRLDECASCHTEHKPHPPKEPKVETQALLLESYRSIFNQEG